MYGVVHILSVDGYSHKIVGFITLLTKNTLAIYRYLFKPILSEYGLWEQMRLDHCTEFALVKTVQEILSHLQQNSDRLPVLQSLSRHNHRAGKVWPEVNARINYPLKRILVGMEENNEIDMANSLTKFSVSWVCINVLRSAVKRFVESWNAHTIPGNH